MIPSFVLSNYKLYLKFCICLKRKSLVLGHGKKNLIYMYVYVLVIAELLPFYVC